MKKFIIKTLLFLSPIITLAILNLLFLTNTGELHTATSLSLKNQKDNALIGIAYSDPVKQFKFKNIQYLKPETLVLGTSRVLQFRDIYFKNPSQFYNAGRCITQLNDIETFLENYPTQLPQMIILGLDQNFFNSEWDNLSKPGFSQFNKQYDFSEKLLSCSRSFTPDLLKNKINWNLFTKNDTAKIGFTALTHNEGFRVDGSYLYGRHLLSTNGEYGYEFTKTLGRLNKKNSRFSESSINPKAMKTFEKLLEFCSTNNIRLITFLPPYAHKVYNELKKQKERLPYIFDLYSSLLPLCKKHNHLLYDFSDIKTLEANDFETIDGFHGSETAYLKIIQIMADNSTHLTEVLDAKKVQYFLQKPYSARQLLPELEEPKKKQPFVSE